MASPTWAIGDQITAAKLNAIRDDIDSPTTGHRHDGTVGALIGDFGDGSDGDVTISGTTTLTRDMYYNSLTVNGGQILNTAGYIVYVKTTLTNNGTIRNVGGNAPDASTVGTGAPAGHFPGGGNGGYSSNAPAVTGYGGAGGRGHTTLAGTVTAPSPAPRSIWSLLGWQTGLPGGGSGGGGETGAQGAGGGGGGVVFIVARTIVNSSGVIHADGGNGSSFYGGGGGGGWVAIFYRTATWGTERAAGGIGNTSYPPTANGSAGIVWKVVL